MSTIFTAIIVLGLPALLIALFVMNENRKKRKHLHQFLARFSQIGSQNGLTFSSQEFLKDAAIGVDGVHRKLLVLTGTDPGGYHHHLLSLDDIKSCLVRKDIHSIAGLNSNERESYIEKIVLCFELKNGGTPVEVAFYHHLTSDIYAMKELHEKASDWEAILSKMISGSSREVA